MTLEPSQVGADTLDMPKSKVCTRCDRRRPLDEFGPDPRYADGLRPHCIRCRTEYANAWRDANREQFRERRREYESRPEVKARRVARRNRETT
jgi:hypothetical protein